MRDLDRSPAALALALGLALLVTAPVAAVEIVPGEEFPSRGTAVRLAVTSDGAPLPGMVIEAVYRPGSETSYSEAVGTTDAAGTLHWTPRDAGLVTLSARLAARSDDAAETDVESDGPVATRTLSVRYGGFPPAGLAIMVLAGVLLFGGAGLGFVLLLKPPEQIPEHEPPST